MNADPSQKSTFMVIAVDPTPPADVLQATVRSAAGNLFGDSAVTEIRTVGDGTALLHLTPSAHNETRMGDPSAAQVMEVEVAAVLGGAGFRKVGVAVTTSGKPMTAEERLQDMLESQAQRLGQEVLSEAQQRAYRQQVAELLEKGLIRTLFQPIVDAHTGDVIAYEALSRGPDGHPLEKPEELLRAAAVAGFGSDVDWEMRWLASNRARQFLDPADTLLFVNAAAAHLMPDSGPKHKRWDSPNVWPRGRTVTEATERAPISDVPDFLEARTEARESGHRFALDDAGAGYAGLAALALLAPEFVKIDMALVRDCDKDPLKQAIIGSLVHFVQRTGAKLIAEGVETPEELEVIRRLGVNFVQGFLFARPAEIPPKIDARYFSPRTDKRIAERRNVTRRETDRTQDIDKASAKPNVRPGLRRRSGSRPAAGPSAPGGRGRKARRG